MSRTRILLTSILIALDPAVVVAGEAGAATGPRHLLRHADSYWMPKLDRSFGLHTAQFRVHPIGQPHEPEPASSRYVWP
jgi:hypothetical protein